VSGAPGKEALKGVRVVKLRTYEEAAEELGVSPSWLKKRVRERTIPFKRMGDLIRFSESDLEAIADQGAVKPGSKAWGRR
jgi:excisionase family DNA binding protein